MKYIRTEEWVYELSNVQNDKENYLVIVPERLRDIAGGDTTIRPKKDVIATADTIEEICDGFIFKDTHANKLHFLDSNSGISLLGASLFEDTLRGFIETDQGLIYVAKMNDNGEFELL